MDIAIRFESVGKRYVVRHQRPFLARELLRSVLQRPSHQHEFWALRDVSFTIHKGESVAILGTNGSGKSTTLALVAQTTPPTEGTVTVHGRLGPLLELGAGFHPDLTGYENVYLNASLLGLSRREVDALLGDIIEYSGIGDFIDAPIQTYSTGMKARLGFAVVAHIDPDVLLLDEVLSVGDGQFAHKCEATIRRLPTAGKALCFPSPTPARVLALCPRADGPRPGRLQQDGDAEAVCAAYQRYLDTGEVA